MRKFLLVFVPLWIAGGDELPPTFNAGYNFILSAQAATFSFEVPASPRKRIYLSAGYLMTATACSVDQYIGGSIAGGSAITPTGLNTAGTPTVTVKQGGTLTGGTQLFPTADLADGEKVSIDLTAIRFPRSSSSVQVYTIKSAACSTNPLRVAINWSEE